MNFLVLTKKFIKSEVNFIELLHGELDQFLDFFFTNSSSFRTINSCTVHLKNVAWYLG